MFTYDLSTPIGKIRLLIADTDDNDPIFEDEELSVFYAEEGSELTAAALALETMATSEVLLLKAIKTAQWSTDGPSVSAALQSRAAALRERASKRPQDISVYRMIDEFKSMR